MTTNITNTHKSDKLNSKLRSMLNRVDDENPVKQSIYRKNPKTDLFREDLNQ